MEKYKDWDILDEMPNGWKIDNTAGSPAPNTVFITNGKSLFNGQKRALLRVQSKPMPFVVKNEVKQQETNKPINSEFPAKAVNVLARKKFQEQLLKDIRMDLLICEIEGWDKREYILELKRLLNSIDVSKKPIKNNQQNLFNQ